jgi:hypothetical protein
MITMTVLLNIANWFIPTPPVTPPEQQVQAYYSEMVPREPR